MTIFCYEQSTKVLSPIEYIAEVLEGKKWVAICKRKKTYASAISSLMRWQRKHKEHSKGRILALGVVLTQRYAHV